MKRKKILLCSILLTLNLLFIWGNSMLNGEVSGELSGGIMAWLLKHFGSLIPFGELLLRKLGHLTEFTCLGILLFRLFHLLGEKGIHGLAMPLFGGMLAACVDETIQVFTPDRGPSVTDVWIDTAGVCAGIVLGTIVCKLIEKSRRVKLSGG